jgi:signal transduction histidine kinase
MSSDQDNLNKLRNALRVLEDHALPEKAQRALGEALQALDQLGAEIAVSQEQARLPALYRVSQILGTSLNIDEVLNQVMDAVIQLTSAERGFLMLRSPETGDLVLRVARNFEQENLSADRMKISRTIVDSVIRDGKGIVTTNAQEDPRFSGHQSVISYALRSILCAPLRSRGKTIGAIFVDNRARIGLFSEEDLSFLNAFATQAAVAIENAQLYTLTDQALAARVGELETLTQIDRALYERLDFEHVTEIIYNWAIRGTGAVQGWVALFRQDNTTLSIVEGIDKGKVVDVDDPLFAPLVENEGQQISFSDESGLSRMAISLNATQPLGFIVVESPQPLPESDVSFLTRLAARAATAIENVRLYQTVQEVNQAKSKFISVVSHELRLPMTSIRGYTDLLLQGTVGTVNEQQLNFLNVIRNNVDRMQVLVSDLSDISRIETGRLRLQTETISLAQYLSQTLSSLEPKINEKKQILDVNVPENLPMCNADPHRVMQVLTNLINNARKYTPEGGRITITVSLKESFLHIEVKDDGIGISPEDQARLFTQFFRSEDMDVREQQGWGLGLNVTKQLVELMGGEIGMDSKLGEGSTFWFTLPVSGDKTESNKQI